MNFGSPLIVETQCSDEACSKRATVPHSSAPCTIRTIIVRVHSKTWLKAGASGYQHQLARVPIFICSCRVPDRNKPMRSGVVEIVDGPIGCVACLRALVPFQDLQEQKQWKKSLLYWYFVPVLVERLRGKMLEGHVPPNSEVFLLLNSSPPPFIS